MPSIQPYNEKELLAQTAEGDERAFNLIVMHWWEPVLLQAMTYLKSPQYAEETTLDIFEKIWHKRAQLKTVVSFKDWLFIVTRNELVSRLRKKLPATIPLLPDSNYTEDVRYPGKNLELQDLSNLIKKGLTLLSKQQRQVFELSRNEGLTHVEIAEKMALSRQTVKWHMVNALNLLRNFLLNNGEVAGIILLLTLNL